MASWSHSNLIQFIEIYRSQECLWNTKSPLYSNRYHRERAYQKLLDFVNTFDDVARKECVLRKINNIRTCFRKEANKVTRSRLSGSGSGEDVYRPKLWYFKKLLFLKDPEQTRTAYSSVNTDFDSSQACSTPSLHETQEEDGTSVTFPGELDDYDIVTDTDAIKDEPCPKPSQVTFRQAPRTFRSPTQSPQDARMFQKRAVREDVPFEPAMDTKRATPADVVCTEDEHDAFGRTIAHRMRNLPREQRIHAQKLFSDVMYEAELGLLTMSHGLMQTPVPQQLFNSHCHGKPS